MTKKTSQEMAMDRVDRWVAFNKSWLTRNCLSAEIVLRPDVVGCKESNLLVRFDRPKKGIARKGITNA